MSDQDFKVYENGLRRAADRQGLQLVKNRRRDPRAHDYGTYLLLDADTRAVVYDVDLSIDEVDYYLQRNMDFRLRGIVIPRKEKRCIRRRLLTLMTDPGI